MMRRHSLILLAVFACVAGVAAGQGSGAGTVAGDKDVAVARAVLDAQAAAWNRGDVAGYMEGYAKDERTTFVSGDRLSRGWQTVLDRYKANYDTREKMGTLAFTELEFTPLTRDYIIATGRWQLTRQADTPHGRFTLLFRRTAAGWRVVHDHTSSAS